MHAQQQLGVAQPGHAPNDQPGASWHSPADVEDRNRVWNLIFKFFRRRKPDKSQEYITKLPEFVNRMEEALYNQAASKEEYTNTATLEARLHRAAAQLVNHN